MKTIKEQRLDFLNETVKYYSEDTSRRAVRPTGFCMYYDEETGNKCAIGRHLKAEDVRKNYLESGFTADEYMVFALLPEEIRRLGKGFLKDVQELHDINDNWLINELSDEGQKKLKEILVNWCN